MSGENWFIDKSLYDEEDFNPIVNSLLRQQASLDVLYKKDTIDIYCTYCKSHSIFHPTIRSPIHHIQIHNKSVPAVYNGIHEVELICSRNKDHIYRYYFLFNNNKLSKIGQTPSIADMLIPDIKKYGKILEDNYLKEFTRAIGLSAHGIGIGSFVYLRRIFEYLIDQASIRAITNSEITKENYERLRMDDKIDSLSKYLPSYLVENRKIYSILSLGIHSLTEEICLKYFSTIKMAIELILDEQLREYELKKKLSENSKLINNISSELSQQ